MQFIPSIKLSKALLKVNKVKVDSCAIDLSKAFEKVNHHALFITPVKRNLPVLLLDLLENWLKNCFSSGTVFSQIFLQ